MTLKIDVDFRASLGPVHNQGDRQTCLSFAASDAHRHRKNHPKQFCVEWLNYHATQRAGTGPDAGTTSSDICAVLHAIGQPEESFWPYSPLPLKAGFLHPPSGTPKLWTCRSSICFANTSHIRIQVANFVPVVICLYISDTFNLRNTWDSFGSEVILGQDRNEVIDHSRGHALLVVGYGSYFGDPVMLVRNSWGPRWGGEGHAWIREDYLMHRLYDGFVTL